MANHGGVALLIASLLLVAVALADARLAAQRNTGSVVAVAEADEAPPRPRVVVCYKVRGVQPGETCFSVSQATGLTMELFLGMNPNINCQELFVGQWVCLAAIIV